ncbi:MAG: hypothetical protein IT306_31385 [Chloroflexi bacterium]|nr:hypothetical protein [Chloroflexota bacterium]
MNVDSSKEDLADDLRPEYDLSEFMRRGVRGKYVEQYRTGTNLVLLDPDVARAFPDAAAVNQALRLVMQLAQLPAREPVREPVSTVSDS